MSTKMAFADRLADERYGTCTNLAGHRALQCTPLRFADSRRSGIDITFCMALSVRRLLQGQRLVNVCTLPVTSPWPFDDSASCQQKQPNRSLCSPGSCPEHNHSTKLGACGGEKRRDLLLRFKDPSRCQRTCLRSRFLAAASSLAAWQQLLLSRVELDWPCCAHVYARVRR